MIPVELMTMAGGAAMGGLFKFMDAAQKAKREQQKLIIEKINAEQEVKANIENLRPSLPMLQQNVQATHFQN